MEFLIECIFSKESPLFALWEKYNKNFRILLKNWFKGLFALGIFMNTIVFIYLKA